MARVRIPSAAANERFDEITNHGLDPIDEAEAIRLAIAAAAIALSRRGARPSPIGDTSSTAARRGVM